MKKFNPTLALKTLVVSGFSVQDENFDSKRK